MLLATSHTQAATWSSLKASRIELLRKKKEGEEKEEEKEKMKMKMKKNKKKERRKKEKEKKKKEKNKRKIKKRRLLLPIQLDPNHLPATSSSSPSSPLNEPSSICLEGSAPLVSRRR